MLIGGTAFAGTTDSLNVSDESATAGEEITQEMDTAIFTDLVESKEEGNVSANQALLNSTAEELLNKEQVTYTNAAQLERLVQMGYSKIKLDGPISITKGTLNYNNWWGTTKDVYVVCLSGTDTNVENQSTSWFTDLLSGFEFDNAYVRNVKKVILENIPAGSNIIVTGHSLGGMVAQQVASEGELKYNYNIINTVTFGSPLINGYKREGEVKRLGDTNDVVPYLSVSTLTHVLWQVFGLNRENGGYGWKVITAHCESYNRDDVWGAYDVTGVKYGGKTLSLDLGSTAFYHSPVYVSE